MPFVFTPQMIEHFQKLCQMYGPAMAYQQMNLIMRNQQLGSLQQQNSNTPNANQNLMFANPFLLSQMSFMPQPNFPKQKLVGSPNKADKSHSSNKSYKSFNNSFKNERVQNFNKIQDSISSSQSRSRLGSKRDKLAKALQDLSKVRNYLRRILIKPIINSTNLQGLHLLIRNPNYLDNHLWTNMKDAEEIKLTYQEYLQKMKDKQKMKDSDKKNKKSYQKPIQQEQKVNECKQNSKPDSGQNDISVTDQFKKIKNFDNPFKLVFIAFNDYGINRNYQYYHLVSSDNRRYLRYCKAY
ncbi:UNKNOWN [Stylonychia lemnae]|uniref:Uncharacterized protein n=1 Tax=Stylonychia lemnae TaxID=5949 RepID=A0A078AUJ1_STYLE|nr:UNKNOWN [Stylonychia lemnae]|eukprot:CDW85686.1 UNKNOWN [Stylonychia lemnae]